jgi:predicted ATPase
MRLVHLIIANYRNLRSFEIDFEGSQPMTVLLGRNGSGKSYLIEAIVEIFRELELGSVPFAYTLHYVCRDHTIKIVGAPERSNKRLEITVDDKPVTQADFKDNIDTYLPNYVFAYYSGWSGRLERHFDRPTRAHYTRMLKSPDRQLPLRRFFFCRKEYSQLVLLAFFLAQSDGARKLLKDYLHIRQFESALFVLKKPWWRGNGAPNKVQLTLGDARFWYARGAFKGFLGRMWQRALAPIQNSEAIERDIRRQPEGTERLYLFIKNEAELAGLKDEGEDSKAFFGYLEGIFLCDLIDEVRVTVERTDGTRIKFTQMSEGEQQLLTVLGVLLFTQKDESLYLLDEPDTHLNPVWTYDFMKLLQGNIVAEKGHMIIATHNPLMIGSLRKNDVRILGSTEGEDGALRVDAREPDEDPFAMGVDGLLMSELYGLDSVLPDEIVKKIDERNMLFAEAKRTSDQDARLRDLSEELAQLGILRSYVDPYERAFVEAMARHRHHEQGSFSEQEARTRNQEADAILEKLFADEEKAK